MRRRWSGLDTSAKISVIGIIIGIVVALIGALPAYIALRPKGSNISISAVQVSTKDILEDWENLDGEKGTDKVRGSVVDITP
jgi:hypothetical protein